ncbi:hypothetical protein EIKCOROL_00606 [Eikenella corrodens ATCC 23834]|uniref:Uncharacterized protein n=1 Tax=Eikenella corrodens ATCC 23834 TaxID=546274 RepID=C0DTC8_EIKCO|nr:hypothetical protein EIKCOROL_00606 [Eikenella corrodens ATCC 23834]
MPHLPILQWCNTDNYVSGSLFYFRLPRLIKRIQFKSEQGSEPQIMQSSTVRRDNAISV